MEIGGVHMKMPIRIVDGRLDDFVATLKEPGWNSGNGAFSINSQKVESTEDDLLLNQVARREVIPATPTDLRR
jgi:hypothetical protein